MSMPENYDLHLAQVLYAKLCHDLAGPLGSINNGAELLGDSATAGEFGDEALSLLRFSAGEAIVRLQVFRQAYGAVREPGQQEMAEIKQLATDYFAEGNITLVWEDGPSHLDFHARQMVFLMLLAVAEQLAFGGTLTVTIQQEGDATSINVCGEAERIKEHDEMAKALDGGLAFEEVTPHTVLGCFLARVAANLNTKVELQDADTVIVLSTTCMCPS